MYHCRYARLEDIRCCTASSARDTPHSGNSVRGFQDDMLLGWCSPLNHPTVGIYSILVATEAFHILDTIRVEMSTYIYNYDSQKYFRGRFMPVWAPRLWRTFTKERRKANYLCSFGWRYILVTFHSVRCCVAFQYIMMAYTVYHFVGSS